MNIVQKPSPNQDGNRVKIDRIVIHWIVGNLAAADAVFSKPGNASAHYGIENSTIHQYVPENRVAYHAGNYAMNQRSVGIEHSAAPDRPASEQTYKTSAALVRAICQRHNIPIDRAHIIKHSEVVATQCCGTIDIEKIINYAKQGATQQPPMDDRAHFFDLIFNSGSGFDWGTTDSKKVSKTKITEYNAWVKSNVGRAGASDKIRDLVSATIDITKISARDFIDAVVKKYAQFDEASIRKDQKTKDKATLLDYVNKISL